MAYHSPSLLIIGDSLKTKISKSYAQSLKSRNIGLLFTTPRVMDKHKNPTRLSLRSYITQSKNIEGTGTFILIQLYGLIELASKL